MARMRSLKPEFWLDRKLARSLSRDERMLYLGLWNQADEWARAQADPRLVKGQVFPFDDDITLDVIETMLKALEAVGVAELYDVDGDPYLFLPKLSKHQRLESGKVPSRHPAPPPRPADQQVYTDPAPRANESARDPADAQMSPRPARAKHVAGSREHVAGGHGTDESAPDDTSPPAKPSGRGTHIPDDFAVDEEMHSWARELGFTDTQINQLTESFHDYWRAKPGNGGVKLDWIATWRNWLRREAKERPPGSSSTGGGLRSWEV